MGKVTQVFDIKIVDLQRMLSSTQFGFATRAGRWRDAVAPSHVPSIPGFTPFEFLPKEYANHVVYFSTVSDSPDLGRGIAEAVVSNYGRLIAAWTSPAPRGGRGGAETGLWIS